jgi:hypothetical protein
MGVLLEMLSCKLLPSVISSVDRLDNGPGACAGLTVGTPLSAFISSAEARYTLNSSGLQSCMMVLGASQWLDYGNVDDGMGSTFNEI